MKLFTFVLSKLDKLTIKVSMLYRTKNTEWIDPEKDEFTIVNFD